MILRLGFLVAASIAAYAVKQLNVRGSKPPSSSLKVKLLGNVIILKMCWFSSYPWFLYFS